MHGNTAHDLQPPEPSGWRRAFEDLDREHGFEPLALEGKLPTELFGVLYRNMPARFSSSHGPYGHWFDGDGAVSAVRFANGRAEGAVRLVQTPDLLRDRAGHAPRPGFGTRGPGRLSHLFGTATGRFRNAANTSVLWWDDRLFALYEGGLPTEVNPDTLQTVGLTDLEGAISRTFSAHPHRAAHSDTTYNFGLHYDRRTELELHALTVGAPRRLGRVAILGAPMIHDFIVTERHAIFFAPPLWLKPMSMIFGFESYVDALRWEPERGTEIVVVPLHEPERARRFSVDPFFQWHFVNAFEREDELVVDVIRYPDFASNTFLVSLFRQRQPELQPDGAYARYTVRPKTERASFELIATEPCEFPAIAPSLRGRPHRFAYYLVHGEAQRTAPAPLDTLVKLDVTTGRTQRFELGSRCYPSEPVFVPRAQPETEDDGWLIVMVYDANNHGAHAVVFDARRPDAGALARAHFDHHLPFSFHGVWRS